MKEIGKLLYVADVRQPSFSEVEGLLALRTLGLKEVILLHTTKAEDWAGRLADYGSTSNTFILSAFLISWLQQRLADYGLTSKTLMVDRPLVPAILNAAHREGVSLIAASLNRDKRRLLRGSATTELLRASTLPVLILPEHAQASGSMEGGVFTHLVFATDWSPASEKALRYLLSLNLKTTTKTLEIVHVIDKKLSIRDMHNLKYKLTESRKIFLDHGIDVEGHVYAGKPSEEIMLASRDYDATCIVMGTTGKSHLKHLLSPSYSYRVAEASAIPTLVVP